MKARGILPKVYVILVLSLLYVPVVILVLFSFNISDTGTEWGGFTLEWYRQLAANRRLGDALIVSLNVAIIVCSISCVLGTSGALAVAKYNKKARKRASILMYAPLFLPEIVLGAALLALFSAAGISLGVMTIALAHTTFCIPYVFIMVSLRLKNIEPSLEEAAKDLGATPVRAFVSVTLPLIWPGILSGALVSAAMSLDAVVISSLVAAPGSTTLPMRIFSLLRIGIEPDVNALSTLMILAMFALAGAVMVVSSHKTKKG